ncbi:signal peptidase I [Vibrio harveyi]|uniref:signal peptidase I n=1 Tax=Vibrio harveyi TaxID=669 RepID=UPI003BB7B7C9
MNRIHIVVVALLFLIPITAEHLVIPVTDSIQPHVLWLTSDAIKKGDYVTFPFQHPFINDNKPSFLTKKVACVAGDRLEVRGGAVYCNDEIKAVTNLNIVQNPKVTMFAFDGVIPEGKVLVLGEHPRSFDSRYYGLVNLDEMQKSIPLF